MAEELSANLKPNPDIRELAEDRVVTKHVYDEDMPDFQPKEMRQPMAVIHEDVPTGCDACGKDVPVQTVEVQHSDGTPTSLNLCGDCRTNPPEFCGNAIIEQALDQASATAASKKTSDAQKNAALLARRVFWNELSEANHKFYRALRNAGMDKNRASVWVINAIQTEAERLDNHWPVSYEANYENYASD